MKKTKAKTRKKKSSEKRLAAYTAAAGAALIAAGPADAAIQYSGLVDVTVAADMRIYNCPIGDRWCVSSSGDSSFIDIDGDGTNDLNFQISPALVGSWWTGSNKIVTWYVDGGFSNLNGFSFAGNAGLPSNLGAGSIIDISNNWTNNDGKLFFGDMKILKNTSGPTAAFTDSVNGGNFTLGNSGYLGIRFDPGDGIKYGWIHIASVESTNSGMWGSWTEANATYTYTIDGWAYDNSGLAIAAGQTVVPEPTGMALFAAGAAVIMAKRRRKKK